MAKLIFDNIPIDIARELATWYDQLGYESADIWLQDYDMDIPLVKNVEINLIKQEVVVTFVGGL